MSRSRTTSLRDRARPDPARRRDELRRRVLSDGFARIEDLAESLGVSVMTVHRDLDELERQGWLTKIRGGATANPSALVEAGVGERESALHAEKQAIAARAIELVQPGQTIFLDDSTTALALVPHLRERPPLVVATNFVTAAERLGEDKGVEVVLLGGRYHPLQQACFGLQTLDAIGRLHADVLFLSTTAVSNGACYHRSEATIQVKQALMERAARTVLLVDHAKFGRPAPHLLCKVADFDVVVTDDSTDPEDLDELRDTGVQLLVAEA